MNREAMEYAQALINEGNHLNERWEAVQEQARTIDREATAAKDKLANIIRDIGKGLVTNDHVYLLGDNGLEAIPVVVLGRPQGQGHYDPATQSTVRWQQLGKVTPPEHRIVLAVPKGYRQAIPMLYLSSEKEWEDWHGNRSGASGSDLWAELPARPRGK